MGRLHSFVLHSLSSQLLLASLVTCLGPQVDRTGWTIIANSEQAGFAAFNAIDSNPTTFWHSQYNVVLPHNVVVDMGKRLLIDGISVLPRQDNNDHGVIAQHVVQLSEDRQKWRTVASGTWENSKSLKRTSFVARPARYIRLTALTEINDHPWASIAELYAHQSPDPMLDRSAWSIRASSQETTKENAPANLAIDNQAETFWHSQYSQNTATFPHYLTIDLGSPRSVSGLLYQPRQSISGQSSPNGRIGRFRVDYSNDNWTWLPAVWGSWSDDSTSKAAYWQGRTVRYLRLVALSEAGSRGPWASAGDIQLMSGSALDSYQAPSPRRGLWYQTIDFSLVPVAVANIPQTNEILAWSAYANDDYIQQNQGKTQTAIWDVSSNAMTRQEVANTQHDMFCSGLSMDHHGAFVMTGGNGAPKTTIYYPALRQWLQGAEMNIGRGYQSQTTLSDGRIFTIGGSWSGPSNVDRNGEVYDPRTNTWTPLPGCRIGPIMTHDRQGTYRADNHQWMFSTSNGSVFHAGPSQWMAWLDTSGQGGIGYAGSRADDSDSMNGIAVMFDAIAGKILTAGGSPNYQNDWSHKRAYVMTLNGIHYWPSVQRAADMSSARGFHTGVALPDGTVFVTGGQRYVVPFTDNYAVMVPEIYDPKTNQWSVMNQQASPRNYHSTSLLLADGSIFSGGGGLCGRCDTNHFDGEVFLPPYLLNDDGTLRTRPKILSTDSTAYQLGSQIRITTDSNVVSIALMRLGTSTHTVNTDQRRLPFAVSGTSFTITLPRDPGVAVPGFYFMFALNSNGTPSVARTIWLTNSQGVSAIAVAGLKVLHTNSEPDPKTSVNKYLGVSNLSDISQATHDRAKRGIPVMFTA